MPNIPRFCFFLLVVGCFSAGLFAQIREIGMAEEMDLAGSYIEKKGLRVFAVPSKVTMERGNQREGSFVVIADNATKTYWWMMRRSMSAAPKRLSSWKTTFGESCHIEKTSVGFTVFYVVAPAGQIVIASSRGRYTDEAHLVSLVQSDFNTVAGSHLRDGFGFVDGHLNLWTLLEDSFFFGEPSSSVRAHPKLESTTRLADGTWELVLSSPVGKVAHINLARDFSVVSHRIAGR